ncbi:MSMEG_4193 family putative phosphomutase [Kocuria sp.]|uniref:MSMEG_4193 family putative phosphomutase n=1 Tax=Kocuria sp. TaxID=1871328 RepID=UPI0026DF27D3|nr:MSMEG_4193 family putative phosphomutase [Kocuria sp.]MDO5618098.1 MSMEG_4193 family putative phosphomutase [Kocuria sp.]
MTHSQPSTGSAEDKPTTVILVRHGRTPTTGQVLPGRAPGLHLSQQGLDQALHVADRLAGVPVSAIYTSPMERTRETVEPTEAATGLTARIEPDLIECDFGDWTGRTLSELMKLPEWSAVQRAPSSFRFPNGESFSHMQARMVDAVDRIREAHPGQTVVCFSHADPLKAVLAHALGSHLDQFQRIVVDPCSVSVIAYHPGQAPQVLRVNSTDGPVAPLVF